MERERVRSRAPPVADEASVTMRSGRKLWREPKQLSGTASRAKPFKSYCLCQIKKSIRKDALFCLVAGGRGRLELVVVKIVCDDFNAGCGNESSCNSSLTAYAHLWLCTILATQAGGHRGPPLQVAPPWYKRNA